LPFWMMEVEPCVRVKRGVGTLYVPVRKVVEASHVLFGEDDHGAIVASFLDDGGRLKRPEIGVVVDNTPPKVRRSKSPRQYLPEVKTLEQKEIPWGQGELCPYSCDGVWE